MRFRVGKGRMQVIWRWLAAAVIVAGLARPEARADVITLRADEWCPFNCSEAAKPGYGVEVASEIFAKAGHRVEYDLAPWRRSIEDCLHGAVVAVIGAAPVDSEKLVFPQEPIGVWDTTFLVRNEESWRYEGPASLARVKLGGIIGYNYMEPVGAYVEANKGDRSRVDLIGGRTPLDQNLRKLQAGRIGATMESRAVLDYKLKSMGAGHGLTFAGGTEAGPIYIAFSPRHPKAQEYARILDQGIAELRASGRLRKILDRYGVSDWK